MKITIEDLRDDNFEMSEEWQDAVDAKLFADTYTDDLKKAAAKYRRTSNKKNQETIFWCRLSSREMEEQARCKESCQGLAGTYGKGSE